MRGCFEIKKVLGRFAILTCVVTAALGLGALAPFAPRLALASTITKNTVSNLGLVGYWPMDEATGTIVHDFSGNKNTGTLTNGPVWVAGKLSKALQFTSASTQKVLTTKVISPGTSSQSECAWIKPSTMVTNIFQQSGNYGMPILSAISSYSGSELSLSLLLADGTSASNAKPTFIVDGSGTAFGAQINTNVVDGKWHHICGVRNSVGDTYKVYLDGSASASASYTLTAFQSNKNITTSVPYRIGADPGWTPAIYSNGTIDDVRIYNRALSATEVLALYNSNATKFNAPTNQSGSLASGLVGWWTFDGADTHWASSTAGTTTDKSGSGNTGTLTNMSQKTSPVVGKLGPALKFDGTNYTDMGVASRTGVLNLASSLSVSAWLKIAHNAPSALLVNKTSGPGTAGYELVLGLGGNTGIVSLRTDSTNSVDSSNRIDDGAWHLVTATVTGSAGKIYVDSVLKGSNSITPTPTANSSASFQVGARAGVSGAVGSIDDVRIYNRALTAAEVTQLYNMGK